MNPYLLTPARSLQKPVETSAIIFPVDRQNKSILLFNTPSTGLTGYIFRDRRNDEMIKGKAIADFRSKTNIAVAEQNPLCPVIFQKLIPTDSRTMRSKWKFIIILKDFRMPITDGVHQLPPNAKWYHVNTIRLGHVRCLAERTFLKGLMASL